MFWHTMGMPHNPALIEQREECQKDAKMQACNKKQANLMPEL